MLSKRVSRFLLLVGIIFAVLGTGLNEYSMITQRLHIEGLTEGGLSWGLSLILIGTIYAFVPRRLTKILMVFLMSFANIGFLSALWILFTAHGTTYYTYLFFIEWVLLPPWLFINTAGAYYLLKTAKCQTPQRIYP